MKRLYDAINNSKTVKSKLADDYTLQERMIAFQQRIMPVKNKDFYILPETV